MYKPWMKRLISLTTLKWMNFMKMKIFTVTASENKTQTGRQG